jgi:two-component system cell cycle response regulator
LIAMGAPPNDPVDGDRPPVVSEPDSTVRILAASMEIASLAVLRGALTLPPPPKGSPSEAEDELGEPSPRTDTPRTLVLSTVVRADRGTLTVIGGPDAGATSSLANDETILGRSPDATLIIDDPSVSRIHARITRDARAHHFIEDLGSTNGTFVCGRRVRRAALRTGDRLQLGRDTVFRFAVVDREEEDVQRRLFEASMRDTLTFLPNRRSLVERLGSEIGHARRSDGELSVLMIDIDDFKEVNDKLGHLAGDEVLRTIALIGSRIVRAGDMFSRYGGEEFVVLARDAKKDEATELAERLREAIAALRVEVGGGVIAVTVSIGVAALSECAAGDDGTELLARADARMYTAKVSGRDRTCSDT